MLTLVCGLSDVSISLADSRVVHAEIEKDLGDASLDEVFFKPLQDTIDQARSGKVVVR